MEVAQTRRLPANTAPIYQSLEELCPCEEAGTRGPVLPTLTTPSLRRPQMPGGTETHLSQDGDVPKNISRLGPSPAHRPDN